MSDFLRKLVYKIMPGVAIGLCVIVLIIDFVFGIPIQTPIFFIIPSMAILIYLGGKNPKS